MTDPNGVTQDAGTTQPGADQTTTTQAEPTLDDVYRDAGITIDAASVTATPASAPASQPVSPPQPDIAVPDPYDAEAVKNYFAQTQAANAATRKAVEALAQHAITEQRRREGEQLQTDIAKAVQAVNKVVNHDDPTLIEAMIDAEVRRDAKVKALWEHRHKNPGAWDRTLQVLGKKFASKLEVKVDPALVSAHNARKIAQSANATTAPESADAKWDSLQGSDFDAAWQQLISGGA